jgi:hypothetical protein
MAAVKSTEGRKIANEDNRQGKEQIGAADEYRPDCLLRLFLCQDYSCYKDVAQILEPSLERHER